MIKQGMHKLAYRVGLILSIIILKVIKPLGSEKDIIKILKSMGCVVLDPKGVIKVDTNRYITRSSGWEDLDKFLKKEGYQTSILFRECEYWKEEGKVKRLLGKNIGEYFILWEGDSI